MFANFLTFALLFHTISGYLFNFESTIKDLIEWKDHSFRTLRPTRLRQKTARSDQFQTARRDKFQNYLEEQELDPLTLKFLKHRVSFARASYCIDGLKDWSCNTCNPYLRTRNITFAGEFQSTVFGYVGYSPAIDTISIVFRGTRTFDGWIRDMRFVKPDCPFPGAPEGAKVHLGFLEAWAFLKPEIMEAFLKLVEAYPQSNLLITGHSLGGAIATLCALDIYSSKPELQKAFKMSNVFTVGQPRVGNFAFSNWTTTFPFKMHRLVYENDLVPHLPPHFSGFEHHASEVWIHEETTLLCKQEQDGKENKNWYIISQILAKKIVAPIHIILFQCLLIKDCGVKK